jgi:hypothetical protein
MSRRFVRACVFSHAGNSLDHRSFRVILMHKPTLFSGGLDISA